MMHLSCTRLKNALHVPARGNHTVFSHSYRWKRILHPDVPWLLSPCTLSPCQRIKPGLRGGCRLTTPGCWARQWLPIFNDHSIAVLSHLALGLFCTSVSISARCHPEVEPPSPGVCDFDLGSYKGHFLSAGFGWGSIFLAPPVPGSWVGAERRGPEQGRSALSKNLKVEPEKGVGGLEALWEGGDQAVQLPVQR